MTKRLQVVTKYALKMKNLYCILVSPLETNTHKVLAAE